MTNESLQNKLFRVCSGGLAQEAVDLLELGADINSLDEWEMTPLMYACAYGNVSLARVLLERGADYTVRDKLGRNAREIAMEMGEIDLVALLEGVMGTSVGQSTCNGPTKTRSAPKSTAIAQNVLQSVKEESTISQNGTILPTSTASTASTDAESKPISSAPASQSLNSKDSEQLAVQVLCTTQIEESITTPCANIPTTGHKFCYECGVPLLRCVIPKFCHECGVRVNIGP